MDQSCVQTEMKNDFFDMYKKENMKKQRKMEMLPGKSGLAFAFAFKREVSTPECESTLWHMKEPNEWFISCRLEFVRFSVLNKLYIQFSRLYR